MQPEREGNVQQINKKIDSIWEQAGQLADKMNSIVGFLQGPQPARPCADDEPKQLGWLGKTNDKLENITVELSECIALTNRLNNEGFTSNIAPTSGLSHSDEGQLLEVEKRLREFQETHHGQQEANNV